MLLTGACSQQQGDGALPAPARVLHAEVASYDLAARERSRFIVGLFTGDQLFVGYGTLEMAFFFLGETQASGDPEPGPRDWEVPACARHGTEDDARFSRGGGRLEGAWG